MSDPGDKCQCERHGGRGHLMLDDALLQLVAHQIGPKAIARELWSTTTTFEELDFDELDRLELFMAIEEEFGVELCDHQVETVWTIGEVRSLIMAEREKLAAVQ